MIVKFAFIGTKLLVIVYLHVDYSEIHKPVNVPLIKVEIRNKNNRRLVNVK